MRFAGRGSTGFKPRPASASLLYRVSKNATGGFIPADQRIFALQKLSQQWARLSFIDKLRLLISTFDPAVIAPSDDAKIRELNLLRNWIAHGFCYQTTFLLETDEEEDTGIYRVADQEDSVSWATKFPNSGFKSIAELDHRDARLALEIVLTLLRQLATWSHQPFSVVTYRGGPQYRLIFDQADVIMCF